VEKSGLWVTLRRLGDGGKGSGIKSTEEKKGEGGGQS